MCCRNSGTLSNEGTVATCWFPPLNSLKISRFTSTLKLRSLVWRQSMSPSMSWKSRSSGGRKADIWSSGSMHAFRKSGFRIGAVRGWVTTKWGA